jgi:single-strand DNA-binding protein
LVGNLGKDPEVRAVPGGQSVCNFSIATNESWTDKSGQKQDRTEWHRIVVWGKAAEACGEHLAKGRQVYIEGRLTTREWTNKEGQKQYTTEIVANPVGGVVFLSGGERPPREEQFTGPSGRERAPREEQFTGQPQRQNSAPQQPRPEVSNADIPFAWIGLALTAASLLA